MRSENESDEMIGDENEDDEMMTDKNESEKDDDR